MAKTVIAALLCLLGTAYPALAQQADAPSGGWPDPPPPVRTYVVFFDKDSARLDHKARDLITQAAAETREKHVQKLLVSGHTDPNGSEKLNVQLSLQRAEAVKRQLIADNVADATVTVAAHGSDDPLIPNSPSAEPENRRVIIDFGLP